MRALNLQCERMRTPTIGVTQPRLGWSDASTVNGDLQTAYQVQVGSTAGAADLWDSGKVTSAAQLVTYAGSTLTARLGCFWQVRLWDVNGAASQYAASTFDVGLLANSDWSSALLIGYQTGAAASGGYPAACVRKTFTVPSKTVTRARLYATALGFYRPFLNGDRVGQTELAPGWTDPTIRLHAQAYDVTFLIQPSATNVLGLMIGDGHVQGNMSDRGRNSFSQYPADVPRAACLLAIDYSDGTTDRIVSDSTWKATTSANTFNDIYVGGVADNRGSRPFASILVADGGWGTVSTSALPSAPIQMQPYQHIKKQEALTAAAVTNPATGVYVFDLGQNHAGIPRLTVAGLASGTTITLQCAEDTKKSGDGTLYTANLRTALQRNVFTADGTPTQVFESVHTYQGFRYVAVTGLPSAPIASQMQSSVVHVDSDEVGTFTSSSALLNSIWSAVRWSHRSCHYSIATDCPQRDERLGWTADALLFARSATCLRDVSAQLSKYALDIADGSASGQGPDVAPYINEVGRGNVGWGDAITMIPWTLYQVYGDPAILAQNYAAMKQQLGTLPFTNNAYGDYLNINDAPEPVVLEYSHSYRVANTIAKIATILGDTATANTAASQASSYLNHFQTFIASDGTIGQNAQTSYVLALAFGMVPSNQVALCAGKLSSSIGSKGLTTGFIGLAYVYDALADNGYLSQAMGLALNTSYPSLGDAILNNGCTTVPEQWNPRVFQNTSTSQDANSYNHEIRGCLASWLVRTLVGIDTDASAIGFANVIVRPRPAGAVTSARGTFQGPRGYVEVSWAVLSSSMTLFVSIPANSTSTLTLPVGYTQATVGGADISTVGTSTTADPVTGGVRWNLPSGVYAFTLTA